MFSNVLALKNTPKILKKDVRYGPKSTFFCVFFLDRFFLIFCSHFGSIWAPLGTPGDTIFGQHGVPRFDLLQFFFGSRFGGRGNFWTTLGHFLADLDHFRAPFHSLLLAFGDVLRVSLISVDFYAFPANFLTFPLKFLTFSSWKVWSILAV